MSIRHKFVSSIADDEDPDVIGPDAWNDDHEGLVLPLGMPYGTLERTYTFDSTVESWTTDLGTLSSTGGRLRLANGGSGNATALEPSGAGSVANGEVQMILQGVSAHAIHVALRAADANNHYLLEVRPTGLASAGIRLYKRVSGTYTQLDSNSIGLIPIRQQQPFIATVRFVGQRIETYLNNTLSIVQVADGTYTTGRIGFGVATSGTGEADDVRVYSITTETQGSPGSGDRA